MSLFSRLHPLSAITFAVTIIFGLYSLSTNGNPPLDTAIFGAGLLISLLFAKFSTPKTLPVSGKIYRLGVDNETRELLEILTKLLTNRHFDTEWPLTETIATNDHLETSTNPAIVIKNDSKNLTIYTYNTTISVTYTGAIYPRVVIGDSTVTIYNPNASRNQKQPYVILHLK